MQKGSDSQTSWELATTLLESEYQCKQNISLSCFYRIWENKKYPIRLILNGQASKEIEWHCKHYVGRGLMKRFESGNDVAKEMGLDPKVLEATFKKYNEGARSKKDPFGKKVSSYSSPSLWMVADESLVPVLPWRRVQDERFLPCRDHDARVTLHDGWFGD